MTSIVIFHYHLVNWDKLQIHAVAGPSYLMWVYQQAMKQEALHTGTVKIDPHESCRLKYPCDSYIFKIYQKYLFLCGKREKVCLELCCHWYAYRQCGREQNPFRHFRIQFRHDFRIWLLALLPKAIFISFQYRCF